METRFKSQKHQIPATRIIALPANFGQQDNAKVKVQYIQNHQIVEKNNQADATYATATAGSGDINEVEAENVEYLDESTSEEQPSKALQVPFGKHKVKAIFKDTFYPNAIHCLIDLYKRKYNEMKGKSEEQIRLMCVWDQITKDMNECLFRFNRNQIKQKFKQLRTKYFSVASAEEADSFEYFDQLHDLYQNKFVDAIAAGGERRGEGDKLCNYYRDEQLLQDDDADDLEQESEVMEEDGEELEEHTEPLQVATEPDEHNYQTAVIQEVTVQTHNDDEIAHKEHEFINMVEKELQAIVEGQEEVVGMEAAPEIVSNEVILHQQEEVVAHEVVGNFITSPARGERERQAPSVEQQAIIKRENQEEEESLVQQAQQPIKRVKLDIKPKPVATTSTNATHVVKLHMKSLTNRIDLQQQSNIFPVRTDATSSPPLKEMTLANYNAQQERRHQEKMELIRKALVLQERAIETQRHLMEELIKRL